MFCIHPIQPTEATERRMAIGAAFAAPAVSSDICAAESSETHCQRRRNRHAESKQHSHPVNCHIGAMKARRNAHPAAMDLNRGTSPLCE